MTDENKIIAGAITAVGAGLAFLTKNRLLAPVCRFVGAYIKTKLQLPAILEALLQGQKDQAKLLKDANEAIHTMAARAKADYDLDSRPVFFIGVNGSVTWISRQWGHVMRAQLDEALEWSWFSLIHSGDRERVKREWHEATEEKRDFRSTFRLRGLSDSSGVTIHTVCMKVRGGVCVGWHGQVFEGDQA